ncbi:hypothetical protein A2886_01945 [candidate division WWE3 bacterium RIFCSPHIGHO2_01_FULL_42_13]|uniref:Uncharacterized protein n=1 Tax=candidate division WWE3 bacterium RIFCSPHIGHO2_01_FULL_42_13 TaxID=1802617 RepID=A0A1F4UQY3_UNCKA|nr:MAG: hypothetical protein A2886_01945 [candidate division WWE3 bacterium RIFCSPHIGHO2_01_FULL_42_13]
MNKQKQSGIGLILLIIILGVVGALALVLFSPKKEEVVEIMPEISDVKGLNTASSELDNTNPDKLDEGLNQLDQDYSAF